MRIRQAIVRAVNKIRGVDAKELERMHRESRVMHSTLALKLGVALQTLYDWESEHTPIPKAKYEKAMAYLKFNASWSAQATRETAAGIREKK